MERKHWIDSLRGICMIAILLDHTELYYTGINIIDYDIYVANALVLFFILSGYLMYKEEGFNIKKKLKSVVKTLLLPYFVFSILMAIPKALVHGNAINLGYILFQIISGQSSWFVAALCLSELIFALSIWATRGNIKALALIAIVGFGISILLSNGKQPYPWQLDNSLQALLFLCAGYAYHKYESVFNAIARPLCTVLLLLFLIIIKGYVYMKGVNMLIWYVDISNYPIFLVDILICSLFMIQLCKSLPSCKWLEWTGSHSLVYYFLCGGVPLIIGQVFVKVGLTYSGCYLNVMMAFVSVYAITTIITWFIYKYLPFMVGQSYKRTNSYN